MKSIFVILGMHESGTDLLTRGMQVLGTSECGILPAAVRDLNDALLRGMHCSWSDMAPVTTDYWDKQARTETFFSCKEQAVLLAEGFLQKHDALICNDPRCCRVLPFWQEVFATLKIQEKYVFALQHPAAVAAALDASANFSAARGSLLWLQHVLPGVLWTQGKKRLVVDCQLLREAPDAQLERIAQTFSLPSVPQRLKPEMDTAAAVTAQKNLCSASFFFQIVMSCCAALPRILWSLIRRTLFKNSIKASLRWMIYCRFCSCCMGKCGKKRLFLLLWKSRRSTYVLSLQLLRLWSKVRQPWKSAM